MIKRNFSPIKLGLPLLLAGLMLAFIAGSVLAANVMILNDGFEGSDWDANWDGNGLTSWGTNTRNFHSGTRSARADSSGQGTLTSDDLDANNAIGLKIDFWFRKTNFDHQSCTYYLNLPL